MRIGTTIAILALVAALAGCAGVVSDSELSSNRQPTTQAARAFASDRIVVTTQGSGPDVILIPGLGSSPRAWTSTVAAVPGYRYHLVQVKGFAGVAPDLNEFGPVAAPVAAEIARYIREQRLNKPAVVGHSMGGTMGMMLAARHPDAVGRLMVVDMVPFMGAMFGPPGTTAESVRPTADKVRAEMAAPSTPARGKMLEEIINSMIRTESARAEVLADSKASDQDAVANSYHELITTDLRPELSRIAVPLRVLYVAGIPMSDAQADAMYQASYRDAPTATLARVPDSAHFIMFDQPERFRRELRDFLK